MTKKASFYILTTIFMLILFSLKDVLILLSDEWPHLYPVVNNPTLNWEEVYVYLPFASHFSLSTPLPAAPMANPDLSQFTNFPPITLILQGIILKWLFFSNIDAYLLAMHTILPTLSFWLLFLIYRRYVAQSWALLLAFFGVTFFRNFSSLGYVLARFVDWTGFINAASLSPMELTRTPTPSVTFLFFMLCFYLSIQEYRPSRTRYLTLSMLWALNLYVYLFNFIAGILFWCSYIVFTRYIRDKGFQADRIIKSLVLNGLVVAVVVSPLVIKQLFFSTPLDREIIERMGIIAANSGVITSEWGFFISYVLPVALVILVTWISFADYYELIYRFSPVFIMIAVELIVLNLHLILGEFLQPYLFSIRIGNYFSRYLYAIPVIYFISSPRKRLFHAHFLIQSLKPAYQRIADYVVGSRQIIALIGISLIGLVVLASSLKYVDNHVNQVAPRMALTQKRFDALVSDQSAKSLLVSEEVSVNLLLPVRTTHESLLVNSFNNYVPQQEILQRLILFAHIFNWDKQQFLDFMMPSELYEDFYADNNFVISDQVLNSGFGYWLLNHRRLMTPQELAEYKEMLLREFDNFDVRAGVAKYQVVAIESSESINPLLATESVQLIKDTTIYKLKVD